MSSLWAKLTRALRRRRLEAALRPALDAVGSGPRALFFPSTGPEGAALLRAYNVADALVDLGWQTAVIPPEFSAAQRTRAMHRFQPDAVVLQSCRHHLNRAENFAGQTVILDLDDADFYLGEDRRDVLTAVLARAKGVICGSRFIRDWFAEQGAETSIVWTGTPVSMAQRKPHQSRGRLVVWAQSHPEDYVKEFDFVAEILCDAATQTAPFEARFYGVENEDHPNLKRLRAAGVAVQLLPMLGYADYLRSLEDAAVGLSPIMPANPFSRGKSFGKILAYLDAKVPVICSDEADHALFFDGKNGVVTNDPETWVGRLVGLLDEAAQRQAMADRAHESFRKRLSLAVAARHVDAALRKWLDIPAAKRLAS